MRAAAANAQIKSGNPVTKAGVLISLRPQLKEKVEEPSRASLAFQHSKNPNGVPASLENAIIAVRVLGLQCEIAPEPA